MPVKPLFQALGAIQPHNRSPTPRPWLGYKKQGKTRYRRQRPAKGSGAALVGNNTIEIRQKRWLPTTDPRWNPKMPQKAYLILNSGPGSHPGHRRSRRLTATNPLISNFPARARMEP